MPKHLLTLPHFEQETDYTCLAACARMVLAYYGDPRSEGELAQKLAVKRFGTPLENLKRLSDWGYEVEVDPATVDELTDWLDAEVPPIAAVNAGRFPYWPVTITFHAVVVVGIDREKVFLHDPFCSQSPVVVSREDFEAAWSEEFFRAGMIR